MFGPVGADEAGVMIGESAGSVRCPAGTSMSLYTRTRKGRRTYLLQPAPKRGGPRPVTGGVLLTNGNATV